MSGTSRAKPCILICPATSQRGYKSGVNRNTSLLARKGRPYFSMGSAISAAMPLVSDILREACGGFALYGMIHSLPDAGEPV